MAETERYDTSTQEPQGLPFPGARTVPLPPRFKVKGELGRGGMGTVFWAYDTKLEQEVAVKLLTTDSNDDQMTARFRQEAKELSSFAHPNIVTLLDFGEFEGEDYIVLEFLKGGNLLDWIARKPSVAEVVERFSAIAQGLDYIHNRGIVHRDLKPENILLTEDGVPRITDFGVARRLEKSTRFTAAGTILGTSTYMAPEQIMSSEVGPPADIYSLGVCLFEALTGQPPFVANQHFALLQAHLTETAPSARSKRPEIPEELDRLVARMLKKKPEERPSSAQDVINALRDIRVPGAPEPTRMIVRPQAWKEMVAQLEALKSGEGVGFHLVAPSGSGRSRLLRHFCKEAKLRGVRTLVVAPTHEPTEALKRLWHILGPTCPLTEILSLEGATGCATWLRKRLETCSQPTLLVADDAERHEPTTLAVLRALSLLTPPPNSGWLISSTPAQKVDDGSSPVIDLAPLQKSDLDKLFESVRGVAPGPQVSSWIESRSAGFPRQAKLLAYGVPDPAGEPPSSLAGLAKKQLERLSDNARLLLDVLSLTNAPVPYELLLTASGLAHRNVDRALTELTEGGFTEEDWTQPDHFRVGHDLYTELVSRQLPERSARRLHQTMAGYYEKLEQTTLRGRHLLAAGEPEKAYPVLLEEADLAKELGFLPLAHQLLKSALSCSEPPHGDPAESQTRLAEVALESGAIEESKKLLREAVPKSLGSKLQADVVRTTMANIESEPVDESLLVTPRNANPTTIREIHLSISLHRQLAKAASRSDDFDRAAEHLRQAFKLANHVNEPEAWGQVLIASGYLKLQQGDAAEAEVEARQAIEKTRHSENPRWRVKSYELLGEVQMALGAPSRAALSFQQALELSREALLDKRCLKLERKFHKAQKGEPLTSLPLVETPPAPEPPPSSAPSTPVEPAAKTPPSEPEVVTTVPEAEAAEVTTPPPVAPASPVPVEEARPALSTAAVEPASGKTTEKSEVKKKSPLAAVLGLLLLLALLAGGTYGYKIWSQTPGRLVLNVNPSTVHLTYGDIQTTINSGDPLSLAPGSYEMTISAEGYQPEQRTVSVGRGSEVLLGIDLVATHGTIRFPQWNSDGTTLYINGALVSDVKSGAELVKPVAKYTLKFARPLHKTSELVVDLQPGEVEEVTVPQLTPDKGEIVVTTTPPGALVMVNASKLSDKPYQPGSYRVKASLDGYITETKEITLKAGTVEKLDFQLKKEPPPPVEPVYYPDPVPYNPGGGYDSGGSWGGGSSGSSSGGGSSSGTTGGVVIE